MRINPDIKTEKKQEKKPENGDLSYIEITPAGVYRFQFMLKNVAFFIDIDPELPEEIYPAMFSLIREKEKDLVFKQNRQTVKARYLLSQQQPKPMTAEDAIKPISRPEAGKSSMANIPDGGLIP